MGRKDRQIRRVAARAHKNPPQADKAALPDKTNPPLVGSQVLEEHNPRLLAHRRRLKEVRLRRVKKGPLLETLAAAREHKRVRRVEARVHRGPPQAGKVALPSRTSLPQADSQILEVHNLKQLAHQRQARDRVLRKEAPQEILPVPRGHRQAPDSRINLRRALQAQTVRKVLPSSPGRQKRGTVVVANHKQKNQPRPQPARGKGRNKAPLRERRGSLPQVDRELVRTRAKRLHSLLQANSPPPVRKERKEKPASPPIRLGVRIVNPRSP